MTDSKYMIEGNAITHYGELYKLETNLFESSGFESNYYHCYQLTNNCPGPKSHSR